MWPSYSRECRKEIDSALRGPLVSAYRSNETSGAPPAKGSNIWHFERELEKAWKVKHAVAVNSGTMALTAAIVALRLPPQSDIVTTPYSFSATPASIILAGHRPVFADIDPHHFCLSPESVKKSLTRKTRAILNVDLFGYLPDYAPLKTFGLPVIQDNCQAAGAVRDGKHLHGVIACGSGNGSKNIPCVEAGWAYTDDAKLAERMREYISHGENFGSAEVGVNGRLNELVGCLARHGLASLDERNERRRELVDTFAKSLKDELVRRPRGNKHWDLFWPNLYDSHVYYVYGFKFYGDRSRFISRCAKRGLPIQAGYTTPLHRLPAFRKYQTAPLPVVEELHDKTLCLLTTLTPDRPLSYARWCVKVIRESLG